MFQFINLMVKNMNRSLTILLGVGVVAVIVVLVVALITNTSGPGTTTTVARSTVEIPIGVMVSLTGDLESYGPLYRAAAQLAEQDINSFLSSINSPYRVRVYFEDDKSTPEGALAAAQSFAARGIKIVFTYTSSATSAVKSFASQNDMIIISYASTAPHLAIPGDNVFRLQPPDIFQARGIATLIKELGVDRVIVIYRGDDWGDGLYRALSQRLAELGGSVIAGIRYDPASKDLSAEVARLADYVRREQNINRVGIVALSFPGDFLSLFNAAMRYPELMSVKWFGSDGTVDDVKVRDVLGEKIVDSGILFINLRFFTAEYPHQEMFAVRFRNMTGENPGEAAYGLYDGIWAVALSVVINNGSISGSQLEKVFPEIAYRYFGYSGWLLLDENGDRALATYAYRMLARTQNGIEWVTVGYFDGSTGKVTLSLPH